eukprot:g16431.t1
MASTPNKDGGGAGTRAHPTPSSSHRGREDARGAPRLRAMTPSAIATDEFPFLEASWKKNPRLLTSMLPLCLYLKHHDRQSKAKKGNARVVLGWVSDWLATSEYAEVVPLDTTSDSIAHIFTTLEQHAATFGLGPTERIKKKGSLYSIESCEWSKSLPQLLMQLPTGWRTSSLPDSSVALHRDDRGAVVMVGVEKPDIQGRGSIRSISVNGLDVTSHDAVSTVGRFIYSFGDLKQVLSIVDCVLPCVGYTRQHVEDDRSLPTGSAEAFRSVMRGAERALVGDRGSVLGERWRNTPVRGVLKGTGGVSGVLGVIGNTVDVLWSKDCAGVASNYTNGGQRCSRCKKFWRDTVKRRITAFTGEAKPDTASDQLSSDQKTTKLSQLATSMNAANEATERWHRKVKQYREECIELPKDQGDAVHKFLIDQETRELLDKKLPPQSEQRALLNDLIQGNLAKGDGRGHRVHLSTLKFCIYYSGVAGTRAYNALRPVLHLPSLSHIRNLRAKARPPTSGVLVDNIKMYGNLAAKQDADPAELMGSVAWDYIHLNKNGFSFAPKGAGLNGLVDEATFFNPVYAEDGREEQDLEEALDKIIATQHVEMFFTSLAKPEYKFAVWRESVRSINTDYIQRMVTTVAITLACAHPDKAFDVVCAVCHGANEHRSFQMRAATVDFGAFAEGDDEDSFLGFPVAFPHPVHRGPIFNMSNPSHILKKIANACWHSDQDTKDRELAMWCEDEKGNTDLVRFSLATAERAYHQVENGGNTLSQEEEEEVAPITTFRKIVPSCFDRNSWLCMNVDFSSKVLSGTIVRMIEKVQRDLTTTGEPLDMELECYATLAARMDAFTDIFNGNFGRSEYERRNGLNEEAGYITSANDSKLEELMDIVRFFDEWRSSLEEKTTMGDDSWKKHFITEFSWTDIRVCILGFVSMCRYLFEEDSRFKVSPRRPWPNYVNARTCVQDPAEHRLGHGHPTATQAAKESAARGDLNRGLHGGSQANFHRNARKGRGFVASGCRADMMLPVGEEERRSVSPRSPPTRRVRLPVAASLAGALSCSIANTRAGAETNIKEGDG